MKPLGTCQASASSGFGHSGGVPHPHRTDCIEWSSAIKPVPRLSIGFTGTREGMSNFQKESLRARLSWLRGKFVWFHHGDEKMSDCEAAAIAKSFGYKIAVHPPTDKFSVGNWQGDHMYEALPYLERNREIVNQSAVIIAAPRFMAEEVRSGTWMTIRYARKLDRPITILAREEK